MFTAGFRRMASVLLAVLLSIPSHSQKIPRALLITGNGNVPVMKEGYPPWRHDFHNQKVIQILTGVVVIDTTTDLSVLSPEKLKSYDLVISNSLFLTPRADQLDALHQFVAGGKSFLTLHCGILSFLNWEKYEAFIGGIFVGGPSSEPESFKVYTENKEFWGYSYSFRKHVEHPVSKVVNDFTIRDELYYFQPSTSTIDVIARAENHPVMWWHPFGKGKVMSLTLGHDEEAKNNPGYQQLLCNGVRWLTGAPLIEAENPRPISNRALLYKSFLKLNVFMEGNTERSIAFQVQNDSNHLYRITTQVDGNLDVRLTGKVGDATTTVHAKNSKGLSASKDLHIRIVNDGEGNIASYLGNSVIVSSKENESSLFDAGNIIDGDMTTRWSSAPADSMVAVLDLTKLYTVGKVALNWEAAFASDYKLLISTTGAEWQQVKVVTDSDGGEDILLFTPREARFIKIIGTERASGKWGYSLYEVEVFQN
jgi:type 1 glutamine amidotransferase